MPHRLPPPLPASLPAAVLSDNCKTQTEAAGALRSLESRVTDARDSRTLQRVTESYSRRQLQRVTDARDTSGGAGSRDGPFPGLLNPTVALDARAATRAPLPGYLVHGGVQYDRLPPLVAPAPVPPVAADLIQGRVQYNRLEPFERAPHGLRLSPPSSPRSMPAAPPQITFQPTTRQKNALRRTNSVEPLPQGIRPLPPIPKPKKSVRRNQSVP